MTIGIRLCILDMCGTLRVLRLEIRNASLALLIASLFEVMSSRGTKRMGKQFKILVLYFTKKNVARPVFGACRPKKKVSLP